MKSPYLQIALPGFILPLAFPVSLPMWLIFGWPNLVTLIMGIITIGLPCLMAAPIFWLSARLFDTGIQALPLGLTLVALTIPSVYIFIEGWLLFRSQDGPAVGYTGLFYIVYSPVWLTALIAWAIYCSRKA